MRLIDANRLIEEILIERDKLPLTVPAATYELVREKPNTRGESIRAGLRKALRCINNAQTVDHPDCSTCSHGKGRNDDV